MKKVLIVSSSLSKFHAIEKLDSFLDFVHYQEPENVPRIEYFLKYFYDRHLLHCYIMYYCYFCYVYLTHFYLNNHFYYCNF